MPLVLAERKIERIHIVDDDPDARQGYCYSIEDLDVEPVMHDREIPNIEDFLAGIDVCTEAVLSDYHLRKHRYSRFDGDELVAACYQAGVTSMLCTTFTDINDSLSRANLRYIPAMLKTSSPEPEEVIGALECCATELAGVFHPARKAWRTQVKVVEIDDDDTYFYVVVHAWGPNKKIKLYREHVPHEVNSVLAPGQYFYAKVNTGAERYEDLYFGDWETL